MTILNKRRVLNDLTEKEKKEAVAASADAISEIPMERATPVDDRTPRLTFGCRHLPFDPEKHVAAWGARLLYDEVMAGGRGLVYDRQSCIGREPDIRSIHPTIDEWVDEFRRKKIPASSQGTFTIAHPEFMVMGSPQGSFGYIYVTGVLFKESDDGRYAHWTVGP